MSTYPVLVESARVEAVSQDAVSPELERQVYRTFDRIAKGKYDSFWADGVLVLEFRKGHSVVLGPIALMQLHRACKTESWVMNLVAEGSYQIIRFTPI